METVEKNKILFPVFFVVVCFFLFFSSKATKGVQVARPLSNSDQPPPTPRLIPLKDIYEAQAGRQDLKDLKGRTGATESLQPLKDFVQIIPKWNDNCWKNGDKCHWSVASWWVAGRPMWVVLVVVQNDTF